MTILEDAPTRNGSEYTPARLRRQAVVEPEATATAPAAAVDADSPEEDHHRVDGQGADTRHDDEAHAEATELAAARESAKNFAWSWLVFASALSILGNGTHSVLVNVGKPLIYQILAAIVALLPPVFLFGSTHLVVKLIKARRLGWDFALTLIITIVVGLFAFLLSYFTWKHLVEILGGNRDWSGLWPLIIDLSIVTSSLALFTLSKPRRAARQTANVNQLQELLAGVPVRWEAIAAVVHEQNPGVPAIQERSVDETADILQRIYERRESVRAVGRVHNKLHHRKINAITDAGEQALKQFRLSAELSDTAA